jgi:monovalent cation:H+ antiporter-2, CPA2 family
MAAGPAMFAEFKDTIVFLAAAGVAVPLLNRFRISPVLSFMAVGLAVGPHGLGVLAAHIPWIDWLTITDQKQVALFAELGVIFLLFTIGLDLPVRRLWSMRRLVFGLGLAQIAVTALFLAPLAHFAAGLSLSQSAIAGLAFALSSTAIALPILITSHRFATAEGQTSFSILLMQDIAFVPLLILAGALGTAKVTASAADTALLVMAGIGALVAVIAAGRFLAVPLMRMAARSNSHEFFVAIVLLLALASALAVGAVGLSAALGALLAGVLLAESEFKHQIEADIEPFKGLLLGLFFVSVGMSIDLAYVAGRWVEVAFVVVLVFAVKAGVLAVLVPAFRQSAGTGVSVAFLLGHASEFTLILLGAATASGVFPADEAQWLIASAALSMAMTPLTDIAGRMLSRLVEGHRSELPTLATADLDGAVIIGGFGRVGRTIARVLDAENIPYFALDTDPTRVNEARLAGLPVFFGDASRKEVLMRAGANRAPAFVVTMDQPQLAERMVRAVKGEWPSAQIFVRAKDWAHADHLRSLGVDDVIPEAVEGSLQLAGFVLEGLGFPPGSVIERIDAERERAKSEHL